MCLLCGVDINEYDLGTSSYHCTDLISVSVHQSVQEASKRKLYASDEYIY